MIDATRHFPDYLGYAGDFRKVRENFCISRGTMNRTDTAEGHRFDMPISDYFSQWIDKPAMA